jgi:hypothetical protein
MKTFIEKGHMPHDAASPLPRDASSPLPERYETTGQQANLAGGP